MALSEDPRFKRAPFTLSSSALSELLSDYRHVLNRAPWTHCGFASIPPGAFNAPAVDVTEPVSNSFRLGPASGFEGTPVVVTTGLRTSRFAPILFWEVLHILAADGLWIDIDESSRCTGTPLIAEDHLSREYFRECLRPSSRQVRGPYLIQAFRKTGTTRLAAHIDDASWTFGIVTSGPASAPWGRAARMASSILALDLPQIEVVFCGPRPADAPSDVRVSAIDLDRPDPRGWTTRKRNLIVKAARHENLCLLDDRFEITPEWAQALEVYGRCFSFLTFPQVFVADVDRRFSQRCADYQALYQHEGVERALESSVYARSRVFHASYDDFYETAFCTSGLYVTKRSLWSSAWQDEALFAGEWEDASFGLECQRRGIPHRVNPFLTVEASTAHPMTLTRVHDLVEPDRPVQGRLRVASEQADAARTTPERFRPVIGLTQEAYYSDILKRFNAIPDLPKTDRLEFADIASCRGLADFWRVIESRLTRLPLRTRDEVAAIVFFLSDTVDSRPNCELLAAVRAAESAAEPAQRRVLLLADVVACFDEVERYYPVLFADSLQGVAA